MAFGLENVIIAREVDYAINLVTYNRPQEPNYELGPWSYPISTFLARFFQLKHNSPQYTDEEAAAVTYFGMVAEQPEPTAEFTDISIDWTAVDTIAYNIQAYDPIQKDLGPNGLLVYFENKLLTKTCIKKDGHSYIGIKKNDKGKWRIYFIWEQVRVTRTLQESYVDAVYHLNRYLAYNGLYSGVQKTLSEESRKLQGLRAQALASQQAAAKALALSRASEDVQEEAVKRYEKQLKEAQVKEDEINDYLNKLSNVPEGQGNISSSGTSSIIPLALGAAAAFFALR